MKRGLGLALVLAASLLFPALHGTAQAEAGKKTKVVEDRLEKSRGSGEDSNIKSKSDKNDPNAKVQAPASKGGPKARGGSGYCSIYVDNYSQWKIQIFVDGSYQALVGPYGGAWVNAGEGATKLYARADFDDGSVKTAGPHVFNCEEYSNYTWKVE